MAAPAGMPLAGNKEWITHDEQLRRIEDPVIIGALSKNVLNPIARLILQYAEPKPDWYTVLCKINMLPNLIPALPGNINEILSSNCPIRKGEINPDGIPLKIWQTHLLYLIPPGTLNEFVQRVNEYGRERLAECQGKDSHPLRFRFIRDEYLRNFGNTRINEPRWILISKDVLPKSRGLTYQEQANMVDNLSKKASAKYNVPSLRTVTVVALLHKIATGESILQAGNEQNKHVFTYARVPEKDSNGYNLIVGGLNDSGLSVRDDEEYSRKNESVGVLAEREL